MPPVFKSFILPLLQVHPSHPLMTTGSTLHSVLTSSRHITAMLLNLVCLLALLTGPSQTDATVFEGQKYRRLKQVERRVAANERLVCIDSDTDDRLSFSSTEPSSSAWGAISTLSLHDLDLRYRDGRPFEREVTSTADFCSGHSKLEQIERLKILFDEVRDRVIANWDNPEYFPPEAEEQQVYQFDDPEKDRIFGLLRPRRFRINPNLERFQSYTARQQFRGFIATEAAADFGLLGVCSNEIPDYNPGLLSFSVREFFGSPEF